MLLEWMKRRSAVHAEAGLHTVAQDDPWYQFLLEGPALPNPGKLDNVKSEANDMLEVNTFDGAQFNYTKPVMYDQDKQFMYTHRVAMGSTRSKENASYDLETQLALGSDFVMAGVVDHHRALMGQVIKTWQGAGLTTMLQFQCPPAPNPGFMLAEATHRGASSVSVVRLSGHLVGASHMQAVSENWSVGSELNLMNGQMPSTTHAVVYNNKTQTLGLLAKPQLLDAFFLHRVTSQFSLASTVQMARDTHESEVSAGFKYTPTETMVVRASLTGSGAVSMLFETAVMNFFKLSLAGEIDHSTKEYRFGYGVTMG